MAFKLLYEYRDIERENPMAVLIGIVAIVAACIFFHKWCRRQADLPEPELTETQSATSRSLTDQEATYLSSLRKGKELKDSDAPPIRTWEIRE